MDSLNQIRNHYLQLEPKYRDLIGEVEFILKIVLEKAHVKIHSVTSRVKSLESLLKKSEDKRIENPFDSITDIAGVRIVCLFRSDLDRIEKIVNEAFHMISMDDKVKHSDGFGYMSVHYICQMSKEHSGPRYDYIRGLNFEIQTRTLYMDAWAAVSHYLSYKGDWDAPEDLKHAMNALSGLFYVADNEFLHVYNASLKSKSNAKNLIENQPKENIPINLDTIVAYIRDKFPDRLTSTDDQISKIVHQLVEAKYENIEDVDTDMNNAKELMEEYEKDLLRQKNLRSEFRDLGALRVTLAIANEQMDRFRSDSRSYDGYDRTTKIYRDKYIEKYSDRSRK